MLIPMRPSHLAAEELARSRPRTRRGDHMVMYTVVAVTFFAGGTWAEHLTQARPEHVAEVKHTPVPKTDWSTFKCSELVALCRTRAKQRVEEVIR